MKFINEQYSVTSMNSWPFNIGKFHICTLCYKYEVDQLKSIRNFPISLELVNNENESAEDIQLRLSIDSLHVRVDSELTTPQGVLPHMNMNIIMPILSPYNIVMILAKSKTSE